MKRAPRIKLAQFGWDRSVWNHKTRGQQTVGGNCRRHRYRPVQSGQRFRGTYTDAGPAWTPGPRVSRSPACACQARYHFAHGGFEIQRCVRANRADGRRGINVVSSCEELLFPQLREPRLAARLDRICRKAGARIVGTGVNPGFVMDLLPLCLTGVSGEVRQFMCNEWWTLQRAASHFSGRSVAVCGPATFAASFENARRAMPG